MSELITSLSDTDLLALKRSHQQLEHPSLAARMSNVIGTPFEIGVRLLPQNWYRKFHAQVDASIHKALKTAISTLHKDIPREPQNAYHQTLGMATGAMGGLFGLPSLLLELPITTTLMLRSIADIARHHGENLNQLEARLACMQVFALGAHSEQDDASETGYYGIRIALALAMNNLSQHVATQGMATEGAPLLLRAVNVITSRFGVAISEKAAAQIAPVIGAAGGAAINVIFMQHFQQIAQGHFTVRQLERKYGPELIQQEYNKLTLEES